MIDVIRIGTGNLSYTSDEMMNKLTMEEKLLGIIHLGGLHGF